MVAPPLRECPTGRTRSPPCTSASVVRAVIGFINRLIGAWNRLQFHIPTITLPGGLTFGGGSFGVAQIPEIPTFARGGIVPGTLGAPTLAVVHGGERVIPAGQRGGLGQTTINITVQGNVVTEQDLLTALWNGLKSLNTYGTTMGVS